MKTFFAQNIITGLDSNIQEYSHPIAFDNPFGIMDDDSCSCSLIKIKGSRKDTDYCEERELSLKDYQNVYQQDLFSIKPQIDHSEKLIQKVRGARIEQQERINCYLKQFDVETNENELSQSNRSQIKSLKQKKIKKSRR